MKIGVTHPLIAATVQLLLWWVTGNAWYGVAASAFYLGRELAQAEYRWIERYGGGKRANMPFTGQFEPRVWDLHSVTDVLLPVALTVVIAYTL